MRGSLLALQQAQIGQDAGSGADGGHLLAGLGKGLDGAGHGGIGGQVGGAGDAAGQHHQVHIAVVHILGQSVGGDGDLVAAGDRQAARGRSHHNLDLAAPQQIHNQKGLALLSAFSEKYNCFAHRCYLHF